MIRCYLLAQLHFQKCENYGRKMTNLRTSIQLQLSNTTEHIDTQIYRWMKFRGMAAAKENKVTNIYHIINTNMQMQIT